MRTVRIPAFASERDPKPTAVLSRANDDCAILGHIPELQPKCRNPDLCGSHRQPDLKSSIARLGMNLNAAAMFPYDPLNRIET